MGLLRVAKMRGYRAALTRVTLRGAPPLLKYPLGLVSIAAGYCGERPRFWNAGADYDCRLMI
jgi:hypothetical protein